MAFVEGTLIAGFILWSLISVCYAIRLRRLHRLQRALARLNWFEAWTGWGLFNARDPAVRPVYFVFEYRDRAPSGSTGPWTAGMTGYDWSWRGWLWNPERRRVDGIHYLGKAIKACLETGAPAGEELQGHAAVVENYLRRHAPPPPGTARDIRLMRRMHSPRDPGGEQIYASNGSVCDVRR